MGPGPDEQPPTKPVTSPGPSPEPEAVADVARRIALACSYCRGSTPRAEAVFCASCLAPHHADCFRTHGRCSLPGCGEEETVRPGAHSGQRTGRPWLPALLLAAGVGVVTAVVLAAWPATPAPTTATGARVVTDTVAVRPTPASAPDVATDDGPGAPATLFGRPLDSRAFVLALDVSSSMRVIDLPPGEVWVDHHGKEHIWRDPGPGPPEERSRFTRMKREVVRLVGALREDTSFALVVFGSQARSWRPSLLPATPAIRRAAASFVSGLPWEGGTVTQDALELAFAFREADTVVLVTDGVPERLHRDGSRVEASPPVFVKHSRALNPGRLRLHCYGFFGSSASVHRFLHDLAAAHDGEYRDILPE